MDGGVAEIPQMEKLVWVLEDTIAHGQFAFPRPSIFDRLQQVIKAWRWV